MTPTTQPAPSRRHSRRLGTALTALCLALTGCGSAVTAPPAATDAPQRPVTIGNCGRELSFAATPNRIVGMMPSQTELLIRLGATGSLAGQAQTAVSALPDAVAHQAAHIPVLSTDAPPAREDLLAVTPDLVVSPTEYEFTATQGFASIDQLNSNGAQAYVATGGCAERRRDAQVTDLLTDIANLGAILRIPETADELVRTAQQRLDAVAAATAGKPRPRVAQLYVDGNTLTAIGASVEADIVRTAGGENVFDPDAPEFASFFAAQITPEEIIARNPDVIVFSVSGPESEQHSRDYLIRTFGDVTAVRENRLIPVAKSDLFPGTLGNIDAVELIARQLHPEGS